MDANTVALFFAGFAVIFSSLIALFLFRKENKKRDGKKH